VVLKVPLCPNQLINSTGKFHALCHVCCFLAVGEESGASLFKRELEAETSTERDEQVPLPARSQLHVSYLNCADLSLLASLSYLVGLVSGIHST